jgi:hypothetical protein
MASRRAERTAEPMLRALRRDGWKAQRTGTFVASSEYPPQRAMDGLSIIAISVGVGFVVYVLSLRGPDESLTSDPLPPAPGTARSPLSWLRERTRRSGEELGFGREPRPPVDREREREQESFVYVPVLAATGTQWRTRLGGVVGLIALVAIAAMVVAVGVYQVGHVLNKMVEGFLGK